MRTKSVLITGASGGIGSAAVRAFALDGYRVIMHYHKNEQSIAHLAHLLRENRCEFLTVQADLTDAAARRRLAAHADSIDVLVNNAGISCSGPFCNLSDAELMQIMHTNLTSAMLLTRDLLPGMLYRKRGKILNVSSIWGMVGASCEVAYSAAKAGLIGFTKALAKEVAQSGICVNCIAPGAVRTDMLREYTQSELAAFAKATPLGRLGEPSDIAAAMLFLASAKADFITGQVLSPNGGIVV